MTTTQPEVTTDTVSEPLAKDGDSVVDEIKELNGPKGLEPTRFGDWERKGRCIDF